MVDHPRRHDPGVPPVGDVHRGGKEGAEMQIEAVKKAKRDAEELVRRAQEVIDEYGANDCGFVWGSKATGSLRRQSMELTRSLATMRKA